MRAYSRRLCTSAMNVFSKRLSTVGSLGIANLVRSFSQKACLEDVMPAEFNKNKQKIVYYKSLDLYLY